MPYAGSEPDFRHLKLSPQKGERETYKPKNVSKLKTA